MMDDPKSLSAFSVELFPTGLLVIDEQQQICIANEKLASMFGYQVSDLIGKSLSILVADGHSHHDVLVERYLNNPEENYAMAAGRSVTGKTKQGQLISVEVNLSAREVNGKKYSFASVQRQEQLDKNRLEIINQHNRLNRAVNASNDALWEWDIRTDSVWMSPVMCRYLGSEQDTISFQQWIEHVHPDDCSSVVHDLRQLCENKTSFDRAYRARYSSGTYHWMRARGKALYDKADRAILVSGTLLDIDSMKRLELQLEEKTTFLSAVLESTLAGIYIFDIPTQRNVFVNGQYTELTGYTLGELDEIQQDPDMMGLFHPEEIDLVGAHIARVMEEKNDSEQLIYRFRHKAGHWIWFLSKDSVYAYDDAGNPTQMLGSFVEVTDLKEREQKIELMAKEYSATFEQAAVGIAHVGLDGRWLKVNNKLCEIFKYSREQLLATTFQNITHPDDVDADLALVGRLLNGEQKQYRMEKRYYRGDKEIIWANLTVAIVENELGENSHFISVIEDISERKAAEQMMKESNQALESFAYSASHDLQEPLRKIIHFSNGMVEKLPTSFTNKDILEDLEKIRNASSRMRDLIDSLLQLSRFSNTALKKSHCLISEIVDAVKDNLSRLINESGAQVEINQDLEIYVDRMSFVRLFQNLVSNSIRFAHEGIAPQIQIQARQRHYYIEIKVSDNGQGFDNRRAEDIFAPFKRLVPRLSPGNGMGLAIVRQIVKMHGGSIQGASEHETGAEFTIKLPTNVN